MTAEGVDIDLYADDIEQDFNSVRENKMPSDCLAKTLFHFFPSIPTVSFQRLFTISILHPMQFCISF